MRRILHESAATLMWHNVTDPTKHCYWPNLIKLQNQTESWATLQGSITSCCSGKEPLLLLLKEDARGPDLESNRNLAYHSSSILINTTCKCTMLNLVNKGLSVFV